MTSANLSLESERQRLESTCQPRTSKGRDADLAIEESLEDLHAMQQQKIDQGSALERSKCVELLQRILSKNVWGEHMTFGAPKYDDAELAGILLYPRDAEDIEIILNEVAEGLPHEDSVAFDSLELTQYLSMLRGRPTLYEALLSCGVDWSSVCRDIKAMAQEGLFAFCSWEWQVNSATDLAMYLRSGASLLQPNASGQVAAHIAVSCGADVLGIILRAAPAALLVEDDSHVTPLALLENTYFDCLATDILDALVDAALECLASLPKQTAHALKRSPDAMRAWVRIAEHGGCATLLSAWAGDVRQALDRWCAETEETESISAEKLRHGSQRILALEALASDHDKKAEALKPREMNLRLTRAEALLKENEDKFTKQLTELEDENRRLKTLLAQREDEILALQAVCARNGEIRPRHAQRQTGENTAAVLQESSPLDCVPANQEASVSVSTAPADISELATFDASLSDEQNVILDIRKTRLVGADSAADTISGELSDVPEATRRSFESLRTSLAAAVNRLAHDLYESEAHFIQELLQNADDNKYAAGVTPAIRIVLRSTDDTSSKASSPAFFYVANNELGLSEVDVRSLCDISQSSKSSSSGLTTGCKGVGWKSCFRVCDVPHVLSGRWRFRFNSKGLGMITPEWIDDDHYSSLPAEVREAHSQGLTVFYLPLSEPRHATCIELEMKTLASEVAQLLFFRRLREIDLDCDSGLTHLSFLRGHIQTAPTVVVENENGAREETEFVVGIHEGVEVAIPLVEDPPFQRVFAVLPVRAVGFRFAVHAPFQLTASRTDVHRSQENACRRDAIAHAFLQACQARPEVAVNAFTYLGNVPAESFWMPVRTSILAGLEKVCCVMTESGLMVEPRTCLLRGECPAAKWVPESLLLDACGLYFAGEDKPREIMCDLGVRSFGFEELLKCVLKLDLVRKGDLWNHPSRAEIFSDIYSSLAEGLEANPSRLAELTRLEIFPAATATRNPTFLCADGLHAALCNQMDHSWQIQLVSCLSPSLNVSDKARRLFALLGIRDITQEELEELALRTLLLNQAEDAVGNLQLVWGALSILQRCFVLGRRPPLPWAELRDALPLPSARGVLLPPGQLRCRSFLGIEEMLPAGVTARVYALSGLCKSAARDLEPVAAPPLSSGVGRGHEWVLQWEVFFWSLGCVPADPSGMPAEGCIEATLRLGSVLLSSQLWQQAIAWPTLMHYVKSLVGSEVGLGRILWLWNLPVSFGQKVVSLKDHFLHEAFHQFGGSYLPYAEGVPQDSGVHSLLQQLGVAMEVNPKTLLKCLRFLRDQEISDVGVTADIYRQLGKSIALAHCIEFDLDNLIYVPGAGYLKPDQCCWEGLPTVPLRRCSRLFTLSEHYGRFGSDVCSALMSTVRYSPATCVDELMSTLSILICHSRAVTGVKLRPQEAQDGLLEGARTVYSLLFEHCNGASVADLRTPRTDDTTIVTSGHKIYDKFSKHRLIVVPGIAGQGARFHLLHPQEAYWAVHVDLEGSCCARFALSRHYPDLENFFIQILRVNPMLSTSDVQKFAAVPLPSSNFGPMYLDPPTMTLQNTMNTLQNTLPSTLQVAQPPVQDGLDLRRLVSSDMGNSMDAPFEVGSALVNGLNKARASKPAVPQARPVTDSGPSHAPNASASAASSSTAAPPVPVHQSPPPLPKQSPPPLPRSLPPTTLSRRRTWICVGTCDGIPIFAPPHARLPTVGRPDVALICRLCGAFGLHPSQIAFAYDPSGHSVCEEDLYLDITRTPRATMLARHHQQSHMALWFAELALAVAHQGTGPRMDERLLQVHNELIASLLPAALHLSLSMQPPLL